MRHTDSDLCSDSTAARIHTVEGMSHVLNGTEYDGVTLHLVTWVGMQLMTYGLFSLELFDVSGPQKGKLGWKGTAAFLPSCLPVPSRQACVCVQKHVCLVLLSTQ